MSARFPTTLHLSMDELGRHGGGSGPHRDGWGIGFLHENDAIVLREPLSAYTSNWLAFVQQQNPKSHIILAHIRRATVGSRTLRNTQPFARELGGRMHLFAHNGMVHEIGGDPRFGTRRFRPIGDTDSELAFCALLERLAPLWDAGAPALEERLAVVAAFAADLRGLGPANFIYTDGDALFAHGHRRMTASGTIEPPGLYLLCRRCSATADGIDLTGITVEHAAEQQVALVASVPLSREGWEALAEGEVVALRDGRLVLRASGSVLRSNWPEPQRRTAMVPGIHKTIAMDYEVVLAKVPEALKTEGFGVLTEVDVRGTLQAKLGVDFRRYKILGACNPALAHQALQANIGAGMMMPCNVIVYEDGKQTSVIAVDPMQTFAANEPGLRAIAEQVREKLQRVIDRL